MFQLKFKGWDHFQRDKLTLILMVLVMFLIGLAIAQYRIDLYWQHAHGFMLDQNVYKIMKVIT